MVMSSPSRLDSLLVTHGVAREDSDKQIGDKDIDKISQSCGFPYGRLSSYLGMKQVCAQDAKQDGKSEPDRRAGLLEGWKQLKGSDATYRALIAALLEMERRDDAEVICKLLKESKLTAPATPVHTQMDSVPCAAPSGHCWSKAGITDDTTKDLEHILETHRKKIASQYATYILYIRKSFDHRSVDDLRSYIMSLEAFQSGSNFNTECKLLSGEKDKLEKASTICQIFDVLNSCTSYINCDIYQRMVDDYDIDHGQSEVLKYPEYLRAYFKKHKISEFIKINPKLEKCMDKTKELILKFNVERTSRLAKVIELKKEIARVLELLPSTIELYDIVDGCVLVTFHLPILVADLVFPKGKNSLSPKQKEELRSLSILWLECNENRYSFEVVAGSQASELNSGEMETSTQNFMPHQCNDGAADSLPNSIWCVKPCPKSSPNGSSLCERFANPGIVLCHTEGNTSFKTFELDLLETKLEVKVGENQVKNLAFSADRLQAYVEFEDEADIDKVLGSELKLSRDKPPLFIERCDLTEVWRPYLVVRGLEDWIEEEYVEEHFKEIAKGAAIEFVKIKGNEAEIMFINPQAAFEFPTSTDFLGLTLDVEVAYSPSSKEREQTALAVKGLPSGRVPESKLRGALVGYFSKHTGYKATECKIIKGVGYMTFEDPAALKTILSSPPTANFFGKTSLEVSSAPISQMCEDPSIAFNRTYSGVSESSLFSPSSSMDSRQLRKALDRGKSVDSNPVLENQSSGCLDEASDPDTSLTYLQQSSRNSSISIFSPSGMPKRDPSGILFTVPEHTDFLSGTERTAARGRVCGDMQVEAMESPYEGPSVSNISDSPVTKISIEDVPSSKMDITVIKYYLFGLTLMECDVKQYGRTFLATFQKPIDFQKLKEMGRSRPLEGYVLSFCLLSAARTLRVTFGSEAMPSSYMLKLHFESFTGKKSVEKVNLAPPNEAFVTFKHSSSVQMAINNPECSLLDDLRISLSEYYEFMADGPSPDPPPKPVPLKFTCRPVTTSLTVTKSMWVQDGMPELNDTLAPLNAQAVMDQDASGTPLLRVEPLPGSEDMNDWEYQVGGVVQSLLSQFKEVTEHLPVYGREELLKCTESVGGGLVKEVNGNALLLAGRRDVVDEVLTSIHAKMARLNRVVTEEKLISQSLVKYKNLLISQEMNLNPSKMRFCSDRKWREMVDTMQSDMFVRITVNDTTQSVIVTGENQIVQAVISKLNTFLAEQTSVEEQVCMDVHHWQVINKGMGQELDGLKSSVQGKEMKIEWPQQTGFHDKVHIMIRGDPSLVDKVKGELEALEKKVCHREEKLSNIPAAMQVISSMDDKLENQYGAAIDVSLTSNDDLDTGRVRTLSTALTEAKLCNATCPNDVRVSVYKGEFTKHNHVDLMVVFIPPDHNQQNDTNLKLLFAAGGAELQKNFNRKVSQLFKQSAGDLFTSHPGKLQCNQVLYCFILPWSSNCGPNEEFYLQECLGKVLRKTQGYNTILFASACSLPLKYPADVFARNIIDSIISSPFVSSDLTVAVYVSEGSHSKEFEKHFQASNCRMSVSFAPVAKAISSSVSSFITLTKGSLLDQQADVYINSTNSTLDLKTGTLSKVLLEKCGDELQKECSDYAPLKPENVVVTKAKNLKADSIYHIALADYQPDHHSATRKFKGTVRAVLRTAEKSGAKSLAIPSLGVGSHHFPAQISAKILFDEVIAFQSQNSALGMKFHFVIFDQEVHQEFSKEFAEKMSSPMPQRKGLGKTSKVNSGITQLSIEKADISEEETDVIVNTTSEEISAILFNTFYPLSADSCSHIASRLNDLIKEDKFIVEEIENPVVAILINSDIDEMRQIETSLQVRVDVKPQIRKIEILGEKSDAKEAKVKIMQVINEIEKAQSELKNFQWQTESGDDVEQYCEEDSFKLERARAKNVQALQLVIDHIEVVIDIGKMEELNKETGVVRKVVRVPSKPPVILPSAWDAQPLDNDGNEKTLHMFEVVQGSAEYEEAVKNFNATIGQTVTITGLKRVQNLTLYLKHTTLQETLCKKYSKKKVEVRHLFHGCGEDILKYIATQGFNRSKAGDTNAAFYGNGVYFAVNSSYSAQTKYAAPDKDGIQSMFICRVIIGKYTLGKKGMKMAPLLPGSNETYDTLVENEAKPTIFVTMADAQAYPEYLVTFKVKVKDFRRQTERARAKNIQALKVILPSAWEAQPLNDDGNEKTLHMFEVVQGSGEYEEAVKNFKATIGQTVTIISLKRVQNPTLYLRHATLQDTLCKKYSKKEVEVRHLFHGCGEDILKYIAIQGFNRSKAGRANAAFYGCGVYFAVNSSYSAQTKYAVPDKDGIQSMFICRVIIGKYTLGKKGMIMAPLLPGSNETYDTLVENEAKPTIFVTMTDAQAYPEYLVTFKVEKQGKT